jgi:hypothetical protein
MEVEVMKFRSLQIFVLGLAVCAFIVTFAFTKSAGAYSTCCKWATNNASFKYDLSLPSDFQAGTSAGAYVWTNVTSSSWSWIVNSPSSNNLIKYGAVDGQWGAAASTIKWLSGSTIVQMEIKYDSAENWYKLTGTPGAGQVDLRSTAAHEFGHALGLQHTQPMPHCPGNSTDATMCSSFPAGTSHARSLQNDDQNGLWSLYP